MSFIYGERRAHPLVESGVVDDRKDLHGNISPLVYSRHAKQYLVPKIMGLAFPDRIIFDPQELALTGTVADGLEVRDSAFGASTFSMLGEKYGVSNVHETLDVFNDGFGDQHFTGMFAGGIGKLAARSLTNAGTIDDQLSLSDYGLMFQTGWFGEIANEMALTQQGLYQPFLSGNTDPFKPYYDIEFRQRFGFEASEIFDIIVDDESGLAYCALSKTAKKALRKRIHRPSSVGCPVARTGVKVTEKQMDFLEEHGHVGDNSGFYEEENSEDEDGSVSLEQGEYTAIDDVLWAWGDYVKRFAVYSAEIYPEFEYRLLPTDASKKIVLG